jgi:3-methyladenine DNA glycosylase AlkD
MTAAQILDALRQLGTDSYRRVLRKHGVPDPVYGVKIEELKKLQKRIKRDYRLALELYETGIYDAMYLAGLIADHARMTSQDLCRWLERATCASLYEYTVPWVAAESPHGRKLALEWIESHEEKVAAAGWATLASLVSIKEDAELDLAGLKKLLARVQKSIHQQPNRVRYVMNGFVIAAGCYVKALTEPALQTAERIGKVEVDMGGTACKVPDAVAYIRKVQARGSVGKKRATARC